MQPFTTLTGVACPLPSANIDTDEIVPARFMSTPRTAGYGGFLLHDRRRGTDGRPTGDHPLDHPHRAGANIIVARRNFGCGSSREAAVYALMDFGIRCVIAPSFGEIFSGNSLSNGLLTARVSEAQADALISALEAGASELVVDLAAQTITAKGDTANGDSHLFPADPSKAEGGVDKKGGCPHFSFDIDPAAKLRLLNGWDDIQMTQSFADRIASFQSDDAERRPWAAPARR